MQWTYTLNQQQLLSLLITLGKYLEAVSKGKSSEAIKKLMGLAPKNSPSYKRWNRRRNFY